MQRRISYRRYRRPFRRSLRTARGEWAIRAGFIVRVETAAGLGYGEIAPIPEFGTETLSAAGAFLDSLVAEPDLEVPPELPCCAFGLSAALQAASLHSRDYPVAALLPAGQAAVDRLIARRAAGYSSFKWKIAVESWAEERAIFMKLIESLPEGGRLRLDANAGLDLAQLEKWLELLCENSDRVEYLEQPLRFGDESAMADASRASGIPIALDESLNGPSGAAWFEPGAWHGPLVIKPALMGEVAGLLDRLRPLTKQLVFSSVFETRIGLLNTLHLMDQLPENDRAIGFDTMDNFDDPLSLTATQPILSVDDCLREDPFEIWTQLHHSN